MNLQQLMNDYKNKYQLTNKQMAKRFGVTHTTIGRWLNGSVKTVQEDTANHIHEILGFDIRKAFDDNIVSVKKPILGNVKAGYDLFLEENFLGEEEIPFDDYNKGDFFLKVVGDSMKDVGIVDGGLVYVKKCNYVDNGEIAVIALGDEVTIKTYYAKEDGITLIASNPDIADRFFLYQEAEVLPIRIIGKVIYAKNYV